MRCGTRAGDGGLSAAGLSGRAPATSLPVAGAGSQRAEMTFLGRLGTDPFRPGGRKAGSAQGQSCLAEPVPAEPRWRDLSPGRPSPPQPPLRPSPGAAGAERRLVTAWHPCPRLLGGVSEARRGWLPQTQHFRQLEEGSCSPAPSPPHPHLRDSSCQRPGRGRGRSTCRGPQATMPGTRGKRRWHAHWKISSVPVADVSWAAGLPQAADAPTRKARAGRRAQPPPAAPGALCPLLPQKARPGGDRPCGRMQQLHSAPAPGRRPAPLLTEPGSTAGRGARATHTVGPEQASETAAPFTAKSLHAEPLNTEKRSTGAPAGEGAGRPQGGLRLRPRCLAVVTRAPAGTSDRAFQRRGRGSDYRCL